MNKKAESLLRSGNFTILYHDNGVCSLYKGHIDYDDVDDDTVAVHEFDDSESTGYLPPVVEELVKALGGKCDSI